MIAGTYTPLAVFALGVHDGAVLLIFMWVAAAMGAAIKLRYPRRFERVGIAFYLMLGWVIFPMLGPMSHAMPPVSLHLMAVGAIVYTVGVGFHLAERLPYNTAIWHGFVLAGATCHFVAIYRFATTVAA
jgi:hemolysin III